jgi:two-component system sensor histidine kinase/response regulator
LREKITTASLDDARRLAHTLKGVAGTLELREVAEAASQTEDALAAGNLADIDRLLDRLEQALRPALAASTLLKGAAVSVVAGVTTTVGHADLMSLIMEFRELLQRRSLRARKAFDLLEQRLGIVPEAEGLHSVKAALARLDFDEALIMLDKVTTRNEITGARNHSVEVS